MLESLQPTYRILWGCTSNSNALSIAKSIGFDQKVLDCAQDWVEKLLPDKQKEWQGLLYWSLLEERNALEAQSKEAASILLEAKKLDLKVFSYYFLGQQLIKPMIIILQRSHVVVTYVALSLMLE